MAEQNTVGADTLGHPVDQLFTFPFQGKEFMTSSSGSVDINGKPFWEVEDDEGNRQTIDASYVTPHLPKGHDNTETALNQIITANSSSNASPEPATENDFDDNDAPVGGGSVEGKESKNKIVNLEVTPDGGGEPYYVEFSYPKNDWDNLDEEEQQELSNYAVEEYQRKHPNDFATNITGNHPNSISLVDDETDGDNFWGDIMPKPPDLYPWGERKSEEKANYLARREQKEDASLSGLFLKSAANAIIPYKDVFDVFSDVYDPETGEAVEFDRSQKIASTAGTMAGVIATFGVGSNIIGGQKLAGTPKEIKGMNRLVKGARKAETKAYKVGKAGGVFSKQFITASEEYQLALGKLEAYFRKHLKATPNKPMLQASGWLGTKGRYTDFLRSVGAGEYGFQLGKLTMKTNPKVANAMDTFTRNFLAFNAHGQIYDKQNSLITVEGLKERVKNIPHTTLESAKFSLVGMPNIFLPTGMAASAWKYVGEPLSLFGIGYGFNTPGNAKYPNSDVSIPEEDRIIHGLTMMGYHYAGMGLSRVQTKFKMKQALVNSGIYKDVEATTLLETPLVEKILNIARTKATIEAGTGEGSRLWVTGKSKGKRVIQVLHVHNPYTKDGKLKNKGDKKWRMAWKYIDEAPGAAPRIINSTTRTGLFQSWKQRNIRPVQVKPELRELPPGKDVPTAKDHARKLYLNKHVKWFKNVLKDQGDHGNTLFYRVDPIRNPETGKVNSYGLKIGYVKPNGLKSYKMLWARTGGQGRRTFRHKKQAEDYAKNNWMKEGAVKRQLDAVFSEAKKISTKAEFKDHQLVTREVQKRASDSGFNKTSLQFFAKSFFPGSGGHLENLNKLELNHLGNIVKEGNYKRPDVSPGPVSWFKNLRESFIPNISTLLRPGVPIYTRAMATKNQSAQALGRQMLNFETQRQLIASQGIRITKDLMKDLNLTEKELVNLSALLDTKFGDFLTMDEYSGKRHLINTYHRRYMDKVFTNYVASGVQIKDGNKKKPMFEIYDRDGEKLDLVLHDDAVRLLNGYEYNVIDYAIDPVSQSPRYVFKILGKQFFKTKTEAMEWAAENNVNFKKHIRPTRSHFNIETQSKERGFVFDGKLRYVYNIKKPQTDKHKHMSPQAFAQFRAENGRIFSPDRILDGTQADVYGKGQGIRYDVTVYNGKKNKLGQIYQEGAKGTYEKDYLYRQLSQDAKTRILTDTKSQQYQELVETMLESDPYMKSINSTNLKGLDNAQKKAVRMVPEGKGREIKLREIKKEIAEGRLTAMAERAGDQTIFGQPYERVADLPPVMAWDSNGNRIPLSQGNYNVKKGDKIKVTIKDGVQVGVKDPSIDPKSPKKGEYVINDVMDVYERDYTKLIHRYAEQTAHIISTHNNFGPKGKNSERVQANLGKVKKELGQEFGKWMEKSIDKQINGWAISSDPGIWHKFIRGLNRTVTNVGLSSPRSGLIKNLGLGQVENWNVFGTNLYFKGVHDWMKNPKAYSQLNIDMGGAYSGYYDFAQRGDAKFKWSRPLRMNWVGRLGVMKETEAWNRISSIAIGSVAYTHDLDVLRGKYGSKKNRMASYRRMTEMAKFSDKEVDAMVKRGFMTEKEQSQYVQFSHLITQGSPSLPFIPLWMSHPMAKPLTIFYRIGYRMTENLWRNNIKPLVQDNNIMPLMRYSFGKLAAGEAMYWTAKLMFDEEARNRFLPTVPQMWESMLNAEFLQIFSSFGKEGPIEDNFAAVRFVNNMYLSLLKGTGPQQDFNVFHPQGWNKLVSSLDDALAENVVVWSDYNKMTDKFSKSINTELRWVNRLKNQFKESQNPNSGKTRISGLEREKGKLHSTSYFDLLKKAFLSEKNLPDEEIATSYFAGVYVRMMEKMDEALGEKKQGVGPGDDNYRQTLAYSWINAERDIQNYIERTKPIPDSWKSTGPLKSGDAVSDYKLFMSYLTPKERTRLLNLEKRWDDNRRRLRSVLTKKDYKNINPRWNFDTVIGEISKSEMSKYRERQKEDLKKMSIVK